MNSIIRKTHFPKILLNLRLKKPRFTNLNSINNKTSSNIKKVIDMNTQTNYRTAVKFQNFPKNFPVIKKNQFQNINLKDVFSVLKIYKPEFKF